MRGKHILPELGALTSNGQIEESELEERFIRSLRNYIESKNDKNYKFEYFTENGIVNYKFKITEGQYSFYYFIRPQYELVPANGVKLSTRSDFYISLTAIEKDGIAINDEEILSSVKSIAVYLDGYIYHATEENCRFFDDYKKRLSIAESGEMISWTLAWSDIERFDAIEVANDNASKEFKKDTFALNKNRYNQTIKIYEKIPYWKSFNSELIGKNNSLERLIWILSNPLDENSRYKKIALMLSLRQTQFGVPSVDENIIY